MAVSKYTTVMQILFPGGVGNVGWSPYTHAPVHPAVNGYWILARGCDLPSGVVTCTYLGQLCNSANTKAISTI